MVASRTFRMAVVPPLRRATTKSTSGSRWAAAPALEQAHLIPSHPLSSHPIHPFPSYPVSSRLIPSHPISSHPVSSRLIPSHPVSSSLIPSHLIASHPVSSRLYPIPSHPIPSYPIRQVAAAGVDHKPPPTKKVTAGSGAADDQFDDVGDLGDDLLPM
jgi:hypothetical protein